MDDAEPGQVEPSPTIPSPPSAPTPTPTTDDDDDGPGTPLGFISDPDGGLANYECSLYAQDCSLGEKCNVWANDGGSSWNATKCVAIHPFPDKVGESCRAFGSGVSGEDTCEEGAFCWDLDPETKEGMCVNYCMGSENNPTCGAPGEEPAAGKEFCVCLPTCQPTLNDCPVGCGCYPTDPRFQCVPDASGELGAFGDPCSFVNGCDPGLTCVQEGLVEGCTSGSCCTRFCDLSYMDTCPGDHECIPWYPEGQVIPGFEDTGFCGLTSGLD